MALRNTIESFGIVSRGVHWISAILVLVALAMGTWLANAEFSLATIKYFAVHKTIGIMAFAAILVRISWHRFSPPPHALSHGVVWQDRLAKFVHRAFYVLLIAMPISGWVASSATGIDSVVFGRWTLPAIAPESEAWEKAGFFIHGLIGNALMVLILLHVGGALFRTIIKKDGTLRRMVLG